MIMRMAAAERASHVTLAPRLLDGGVVIEAEEKVPKTMCE
jgi:hypothetical protein